jgi:type IV secretion system protein VirB10
MTQNQTIDAAPASEVRIPSMADHSQKQRAAERNRKVGIAAAAVGVLVAAGTTWALLGRDKPAPSEKVPQKPAAATTGQDRRFSNSARAAAAPASAPVYTVPAPEPRGDEVRPIGIIGGQRTTSGSGATRAPVKPRMDPVDAPMVLSANGDATPGGASLVPTGTSEAPAGGDVTAARQQLAAYRQQLGTMLKDLQARNSGQAGTGVFMQTAAPGLAQAGAGVTAPQASTQAPQVPARPPQARVPIVAGQMDDMSLTLPGDTGFTCNLTVKVISAAEGEVKCIVPRDVYGADGKVVLIDRGSVLSGDYKMVNIRPGVTVIPAIWRHIRTPYGITVDLEGRATGPLGTSGIDGYVDNRWGERIGASILLSLIDGAVQVVVNESRPDNSGNTVVLGGVAQDSNKLAEEVLKSTINIPPTLLRNHGTEVGVAVRDYVDFRSVYALRATPVR